MVAGGEAAGPSGASAPRGDQSAAQEHGGLSQEISNAIEVGQEAAGLFKSIARLVGLEAALALSTAPKLLALWLLMLPIVALCWITFSGLVAWSTYAIWGNATAAFAVLFLMQVILLLSCKLLAGRYAKRMSFPHVRAQVGELIRGLSNETGDKG